MTFPLSSKHSILASCLAVAFFFLAGPAAALEIEVTDNGTILMYEDGVLGRNTDSVRAGNTAASRAEPLRRVSASDNKRVRLEANDSAVGVELIRDAVTPVRLPEHSNTRAIREGEQLEAPRVRAQFPARVRNAQVRDAIDDRVQDRVEARTDEQRQRIQDYHQQLRAERAERRDEKIEVRSRLNASDRDHQSQELELHSRNVRARLRNADFEYDPATDQVTVIAPSGEEHILRHLPDQALERIKNHVTVNEGDSAEVEIETTEDGRVLYKADGVRPKKLFGLLNRNVDTQVYLNDETGDITELEAAPNSILEQFLNSVTF